MPHVSRHKLKDEILLRIYREFMTLVVSGGKRKSAALDQVLTKTEKVMLAKRLAVVVMLSEGESYYAISRYLKVSPSTVMRLHKGVRNGEYSALTKVQKSKKRNFLVSMIMALADPRLATSKNRSQIFNEHFE